MSRSCHQHIPYGPEPSQCFELWLPKGDPRGAICLIHGGLWLSRYDLSHMEPLCADLSSRGWIVANLEYRRVGNPGGGWPGTFDDVRAGFKAARGHTGQDLPWIILGHSAGGHLALWLSGEPDTNAPTVALAPVADLEWPAMPGLCRESIERLLGGAPQAVSEIYAAANPARRPPLSPQTILHGTEDELVPFGMSRDFRPQGASEPEIIELPCGHFDFVDPRSPAWQATLRILERPSAR